MESIMQFFSSRGISFDSLWKAAIILLLGSFALSVLGRLVFGKKSVLKNAASSSIGILFIYAAVVTLESCGTQLAAWFVPLPFVQIAGSQLNLFDFFNAGYTEICSQVLSMIILAFLVNLADTWLPQTKNIFSWTFFRCLTVVIGYLLYMLAFGLLGKYLPEAIVVYAPVVLLAILLLLLLTGVLKILVGAVLTTVNPIIGAVYTFFFATIVGKQVTKAVVTTAILSGLLIALRYAGVVAISIAASALIAYVPIMIILVLLWYIVGRLF